ncbi:hypothetical protein GCM10011504_31510 [Siccirubricoccus deserti]|nr:hypothetical protein GCM10011504_31510 [Siccirubricoccus deserti]
MFAVIATVLVCSAALATEGGLLYLTRRNAQSGADAAAIAAASAYQYRGREAALAAATEVARRNGFTDGVTVNNPPSAGVAAGNDFAFEVQISKSIPLPLSSLMTRRTTTVVASRAVALLFGRVPACVVALTGSVTIKNGGSFEAPGCAVASNAPGASVNIGSLSSVTTPMVTAMGTCNGCTDKRYSIGEIREHAPPVSNPYAYLDNMARPTVSGASCLTAPPDTKVPIAPTGPNRAYCSSVTLSIGDGMTLSPGIYVFQNGSLTIGNGSGFNCAGCTFVFTGTSPGSLSISSTSKVTMSAPTSATDPDYAGVLFYRVPSATPSGSSDDPTLHLHSVATFDLRGGIYFPRAYAKINSLSSTATTGCLALVAGTVEISSVAKYRFDVSDCPNYSTAVPTTRAARLVE